MNKQDLVRISPKGYSRISYLYRGVMLTKSIAAGAKVSVFVITDSGINSQFQVHKLKDATSYIDSRIALGDTIENSRLRYATKVGA